MKGSVSSRESAIILMHKAIALLDKAGEHLAAARLQSAIDAVERRAPMKPGDELPEA